MPSHEHTISSSGEHTHTFNTDTSDRNSGRPRTSFGGTLVGFTTPLGGEHSHTAESKGGGYSHNNLQPYITCYMFKRIA
jgi:microcystin-dependent protein